MESQGIPPETSNFYCLPGRAGGTPNGLEADRRGSSWCGAHQLLHQAQPSSHEPGTNPNQISASAILNAVDLRCHAGKLILTNAVGAAHSTAR
jgi:hypothetical protein